MGLIVWSVMAFVVGGIGFWGHEYFERKKRIKKLKSKKYPLRLTGLRVRENMEYSLWKCEN